LTTNFGSSGTPPPPRERPLDPGSVWEGFAHLLGVYKEPCHGRPIFTGVALKLPTFESAVQTDRPLFPDDCRKCAPSPARFVCPQFSQLNSRPALAGATIGSLRERAGGTTEAPAGETSSDFSWSSEFLGMPGKGGGEGLAPHSPVRPDPLCTATPCNRPVSNPHLFPFRIALETATADLRRLSHAPPPGPCPGRAPPRCAV